jgi:hypothetical protein
VCVSISGSNQFIFLPPPRLDPLPTSWKPSLPPWTTPPRPPSITSPRYCPPHPTAPPLQTSTPSPPAAAAASRTAMKPPPTLMPLVRCPCPACGEMKLVTNGDDKVVMLEDGSTRWEEVVCVRPNNLGIGLLNFLRGVA